MKVHYEELPEINRYIKECGEHSGHSLDEYEADFNRYLAYIRQGQKAIDNSTSILEIGIGTGWFPILCKMRGLKCKGIEISPQLVEFARQWGSSVGVEPDVELGNIEEFMGTESTYDAIIAANVFEHVEDWKSGLRQIYRALKPNGVLYFESTNKFGFSRGEYGFPLYGWFPDQVRYKMRIVFDDPDIMKLGIDFNQFRHSQLRREFERIGFSKIFDRIEMSHEDRVSTGFRRGVVHISKRIPLLKAAALTFCDATRFLCIK